MTGSNAPEGGGVFRWGCTQPKAFLAILARVSATFEPKGRAEAGGGRDERAADTGEPEDQFRVRHAVKGVVAPGRTGQIRPAPS
jgi:hypothetical protein